MAWLNFYACTYKSLTFSSFPSKNLLGLTIVLPVSKVYRKASIKYSIDRTSIIVKIKF